MIINLPYKFNPRHYQTETMHAAFMGGYKQIFYLGHRRLGKDLLFLNMLIAKAMERVGTYLYLFPELAHARRVIWKGMDNEGRRFLDYIPPELIDGKPNSTEMSVPLINGSVLQLGGSNRFDALMGTNPIGIVQSEFPLHTPLARQYLRPILVANGGFEWLQGTPRGKNHAHKIYTMALQDPSWFVRKYTVDETFKNDGTPVVTAEFIAQERAQGMAEELIRQEYYCDWNIGTVGAYFTQEMDAMEYQGRICDFEINRRAPVFTAWDLGVSDPTCIVFGQLNGNFFDIIYYLEKTDKGVDYFAQQLAEIKDKLGIRYQNHFAPHDIRKREWGASARSAIALAHQVGINFLIVPEIGVEQGIGALRSMLPQIRIHKSNCAQLIDALREYKREYDEVNRVFAPRPLHNWASHPTDAMRYLAVMWRENFAKPDLNSPRKFVNSFDRSAHESLIPQSNPTMPGMTHIKAV